MARIIFFISLFFLVTVFPVRAEENSWPNNKFGIHLAQPNEDDIRQAAELVNSSGGDWGYLTLVIQENDRDLVKWQSVMDQLRRYHLIPIIRLATQPQGENWRRPAQSEAREWANFLDSLNWVIKDRYVILFNEPNHAREWGGKVDSDSYAQVALAFAKELKAKNADFVVMLAGLDSSAPSYKEEFEDEAIFLRQLLAKISSSEFEQLFSAWASHAYPNPDFSGSPWDNGRRSIKSYQWELEWLKELGVTKPLPVFITETGWSSKSLTHEQIASYFETAYLNIWLSDSRVRAVTPFVFNYQQEPFLQFSWKKYQVDDFYPQYSRIKNLPKIKGEPEIKENGQFNFDFPQDLVEQSFYHFKINLTNLGQGYWDKSSGYQLKLINYQGEYLISDISNLTPHNQQILDLFLKTNTLGENKTSLVLTKNNKTILTKDWHYQVMPLPNLEFIVSFFPKMNANGDDLEIQIFDSRENLVFFKNKINLKQSKAEVKHIQNIILGQRYRIVLLRPYYLPRQAYLIFRQTGNRIVFKTMLPLDFNLDGKFSWEDGVSLLKHPQYWHYWWP